MLNINTCLTGNRQLSNQIRRNIQIRIRTRDFLLLISNTFANGPPFAIYICTNHVLVSIAFEIDHVVRSFELIELDIDEAPYSVRDSHRLDLFEGGGCAGGAAATRATTAVGAGLDCGGDGGFVFGADGGVH